VWQPTIRSMQAFVARGHASLFPVLYRSFAGLAALAMGFLAGSWAIGMGPFDGVSPAPSAAEQTMRALPFDVPVPDGDPVFAGAGPDMPYLARWRLDTAPVDATAEMLDLIDRRERWRVTFERPLSDGHELTAIRETSDGLMTHFARVRIVPVADGSDVSFEFIPLSELGKD